MNATQTQVRRVGHIKGQQRQFQCYGMAYQDAAIHVFRAANLSADEAKVIITDLDDNTERELTVTARQSFLVEGLRGDEE